MLGPAPVEDHCGTRWRKGRGRGCESQNYPNGLTWKMCVSEPVPLGTWATKRSRGDGIKATLLYMESDERIGSANCIAL